MKGWTKKPCHGCGLGGNRPQDKVCAECRRLMEDGKLYRRQLKKDESREFYQMVWRDYVLPHIFMGGSHRSDAADEFKQKFFELLKVLGDEVKGEYRTGKEPLILGTESFEGVVSMRKEVRDLLNDCYHLVLEIANQAQENGLQKGHSFLLRLAKGEVSVEQYNEATVTK